MESSKTNRPTLFRKYIIYEKDEARVIDQRSILRVESDRSYSLVHLENGKSKVVSHPLCLLEADLSTHLFFRIHRSHLVNLGAIQSINKKCRRIKLIDGTVLPVAEAKMESLIKAIKAFGD
ncbi:LytR/AlgR family response regulator transcription factor [Roseimarinus sediminis]|uniref:LytR/AlgR family response regulator transcription factor n=1 Tax=Roseimarinus sediminis TaxID=1610899 RepID=UPI003D1D0DCF